MPKPSHKSRRAAALTGNLALAQYQIRQLILQLQEMEEQCKRILKHLTDK